MNIIVERNHREVAVLPDPPHDPVITAVLKARYPEAEGWHHARFAVLRFCATAEEAKELATCISRDWQDDS